MPPKLQSHLGTFFSFFSFFFFFFSSFFSSFFFLFFSFRFLYGKGVPMYVEYCTYRIIGYVEEGRG